MNMTTRVILGIGSGRCGTRSLARLLDNQPGWSVGHERRPLLDWNAPQASLPTMAKARMTRLLRQAESAVLGDVASFYLPYLPTLLDLDLDLRVICLKRDRQEVIESFVRWLDKTEPLPTNHWLAMPWKAGCEQQEFHSFQWSRIFPNYTDVTLKEGIGRYWDEYYERVDKLRDQYPGRILLVATTDLGNETCQREILEFCGLPPAEQLTGNWRENVSLQRPPRNDLIQPKNPGSPANCVVLVPFQDNVPESCESGLRQLESRGYPVRRFRVGSDETLARNLAVMESLQAGYLETLWIDPSVRFHPDSVSILRDHQADLACLPIFDYQGALRSFRSSDERLHFGRQGDVVSVDTASMSFLHVRRHVYEAIAEQLHLPLLEDQHQSLIPFFMPTTLPAEEGFQYRDAAETFCGYARKCGFRVLADCRPRVWNTDQYAYSWEDSGMAPRRQAHITRSVSSPQ